MPIRKWAVLLVAIVFTLGLLPVGTTYADGTTAKNPFIWADVPDVSVIRVNDAYYMSSTTMHMNPGVPIMKSKDLVNWEIVNYVYDILADRDKQTLSNGQNIYGQGSWASSLRYHNGKFYIAFASNDIGKTFIFQTTDIEKGSWEKYELAGGVYHDMSLLFDDDGRVYMVYGGGSIKVIELTEDATAIKPGGMNKTIIQNASAPGGTGGLGAEGSHIHKINGKYYIFNISWPSGGIRTELVHRADRIDGSYEGKIALKSGSQSNGAGVAQGGIVQTPEGKWYGMLFQDHGSVGRIPYLVPMTWSGDGWPVFGDVNDTGIPAELSRAWVSSDSFDQREKTIHAYHTVTASGENEDNGSNLARVWQWNHNPDNRHWSLTDRPGFLRLTTGRTSTSILNARNTLTQRTFGPESSGTIAIDVSHMKDGDYAGIAALQQNYGFVGVKMTGTSKSVVMVKGNSSSSSEASNIPLSQNVVYLRVENDFKNRTDKANFYYSLNGEQWASIGSTLQMSYTLPHFMGYRFALFNYATKTTGGYVDFDYFNLDDKLKGSNLDNSSVVALEAETAAVQGVIEGHAWSQTDGQATKAMRFGPDTGFAMTGTDAATLASGSKLSYKINVPAAGTYNVWLLAKSADYSGDSVHVGVDNAYRFTSNGIHGVSGGQFKWANISGTDGGIFGGAALTLTPGEHELNFWGREDGLSIDRIYLTTSSSTADPIWPPVEPQAPAVSLSAPSTVKPGASLAVSLSLDAMIQTVYAEDITLTYNADVFEYVSAIGANDKVQVAGEDSETAGQVRLIAANIGGVSGASTLALNVTFKVKAGVHDTTGTIAVTRAELGVTAAGTEIEAALSSKSIAVGSVDAVVDKTALTTAITNAQSLYDAAVVGTQPGQYPQSAKDALLVAINTAKAVKDNGNATQAEVDTAVTALSSAVNTFKAAVVKEASADVNQDGRYSIGDLALVANHYGKDAGSADWTTAKKADMNNDGKIDIVDLAFVATKILK
ncbi:family 43 glycosylhydrolase [Paenibacillus methanolicus]|uniref:Beta-xylosidase n=1 Tax=Paenibacillus methanolicus TaxID=582686 RepID=A0A5S5CE48_9BACL|nr:family 43 glycosylhydrolase [Paenibacillus methanolicus]TYP76772.1 beta-xylosidase [Paenibacillus methanolicus]